MADVGTVKALVQIEYNGTGIQQAKEDLASLADIGGSFEQAAQGIGEQLGSVSDQITATASATQDFNSAVGSLEKPLDTLQKPLSAANDSFASISDSLSQAVPLLPQFSDSLHEVSASFDPKAFGLDTFAENMSVFQDALVNPEPFTMIQQHLTETGQTWDDFTSSIGDDNTAFLKQMAENSSVSHEVFGGMQEDLTSTGKIADTLDWNKIGPDTNWAEGMKGAADSMGAFGQAASDTIDPLTALADAGAAVGAGTAGAGVGGIDAFLGGIGDFFGGMGPMGAMMGVQMGVMAVTGLVTAMQQAFTGMYNMATLAEGPAANSFGTFTYSVDSLGQAFKNSSEQFSESFGKQIMPTLDALNYQVSQGNSGGLGNFLGGIAPDLILNGAASFFDGLNVPFVGQFLQKLATEGDINAAAQAAGLPSPFGGTQVESQITSDISAAINKASQSSSYDQGMVQFATLMTQAQNQNYLQAQQEDPIALRYAQNILKQSQARYDAQNPVTQGGVIQDYLYQDYQASPQGKADLQAIQQGMPSGIDWGGLWGGVGKFFLGIADTIQAWNQPVQSGGGGGAGCFPAGTCVLMPDDSERAIETLQVGEQVIGRDGEKQITTTITATIRLPQKMVYELLFADGSTLTLTDSHPVMTTGGWKSLSPSATSQENPGLVSSRLQIGDTIITRNGTCRLLDWHPRERVPVYNITVGEPHTYYANGVLVHNKALGTSGVSQGIGGQIADLIASIQLPHIDLSGITSQISGMFSGIQLPHIDLPNINSMLSGALSSIGINIQPPNFSNITGMISGALSSIGINIQPPSFSDITSMVNGALSSIGISIQPPNFSNITGMISGALSSLGINIQPPNFSDITGMLSGALSSIGINLPPVNFNNVTAMLNGALSAIGINVQPLNFSNITGMINSALSSIFSGIQSILPSIPGFASGVEGFSGGLAVVGEAGPELVTLPRGANVTPMSQVGGGSLASLSSFGGDITLHNHLHIDSREVAELIIPQIAPMIREALGRRVA